MSLFQSIIAEHTSGMSMSMDQYTAGMKKFHMLHNSNRITFYELFYRRVMKLHWRWMQRIPSLPQCS